MLRFDLIAFHDTDLADAYFQEWKAENKIILNDNVCIVFNNGSENLPYFKKSHLAKMEKDALQELAEDLNLIYCGEILTKSELIDLLLSLDNEAFYKLALKNNCLPPMSYSVRGYNEWQYVETWEVGGVVFGAKYLTNLFFGCPFWGHLIIRELDDKAERPHQKSARTVEEIRLDKYLKDYYDYSKSELLENIKANYNGKYKDADLTSEL